MNKQTVRKVEVIVPNYDELGARASVEKTKKLSFLRKKFEWVSSIPLYVPFWFVNVQMDLHAPKRGVVKQEYTIMVNAITNRGMLVRGKLDTKVIETQAIFVDQEVSAADARETARVEALVATRRMVRPPPHRVMHGERLVWYPLALVELRVNGKEDVQVFDYYRGGLDKFTMRYFKLKDKLAEKGGNRAG